MENCDILNGHFSFLRCILRSIGIFCGHLVHFEIIWYKFYHFGILYEEKSGNPSQEHANFDYVVERYTTARPKCYLCNADKLQI
jgi:hypothetical protein